VEIIKVKDLRIDKDDMLIEVDEKDAPKLLEWLNGRAIYTYLGQGLIKINFGFKSRMEQLRGQIEELKETINSILDFASMFIGRLAVRK